MPRRKLTDAERAERKRAANERGFKNAKFRQYNPTDGVGYGSARQWRGAAGAAFGGDGFTMEDSKPAKTRRRNADLTLLELTEMPENEQALSRAYRRRSRVVHPDVAGGSHEAFLDLTAAYERLKAKF